MNTAELLDAYADELAERPWLRPFVEDGDDTLDEAERRYSVCIVRARAHLRARGVELCRCVQPREGVETTALELAVRRRGVPVEDVPGRPVTIEDGGRILRGLALPFDERALVLDARRGDPVIEVMDHDSFDAPPSGEIPLLIGHNRADAPAGVVRSAPLRAFGVPVEAELLVGADELDGWHRRFRAGVGTGLSVGFTQDTRRAVWERPRRPGEPPVVRPRGVQIVETSLVNWPAYDSARVASLSTRTAAERRAHEESERLIAEWQRDRIALEASRRTRGAA